MASDYYIWKWAENDECGHPADIVAQLCAGRMPGSLRAFDPKRVRKRLDEVASLRRCLSSELLIQPLEEEDGRMRFIHLCDPSPESAWLADRLLWAVWGSGLTLYDEGANRLIGLPKRNMVEACWGDQLVDIEPADIPALLRKLGGRHGLGAVACYDSRGNMFQVWAHRRRFAVEWQVLPGRDFNGHRIWIAGRRDRRRAKITLGPVSRRMELFDHEALSLTETQRLWESFFGGAERPSDYRWREITKKLQKLCNPPRHRHEPPEEEPPQ